MNKKREEGKYATQIVMNMKKKPERQKRMNKQTERQQQQKIVHNDC